jgi:hypothetical protein
MTSSMSPSWKKRFSFSSWLYDLEAGNGLEYGPNGVVVPHARTAEHTTDVHIDLQIQRMREMQSIQVSRDVRADVHSCWATVREALTTHEICTVVLPTDKGSVLRIRKASTPEPQHKELYE